MTSYEMNLHFIAEVTLSECTDDPPTEQDLEEFKRRAIQAFIREMDRNGFMTGRGINGYATMYDDSRFTLSVEEID